MIILGVDPGTLFTGFGIVSFENNELKYVTSGIIKLDRLNSMQEKLDLIYSSLNTTIKIYQPDSFSIETAFYGKNVQSALKLGYARGVAILAAAHNNLTVYEYSPREVKKAVSGKGAATKEQVSYMVNTLLRIKLESKFDETDALAVGICHSLRSSAPIPTKNKGWKSFIEMNPERIIG